MGWLSRWSGRRIVLVCIGWLVGAPALGAVGLVFGGLLLDTLGGERVTGLHIELTGWSLGLPLFVPPAILVAAWVVARSRAVAVEGPTGPRPSPPPGVDSAA